MINEGIGSKRRVVGAHYGTIDFIAQRATAVIMAVYTLILVLYAVFVPSLDYDSWRTFFTFFVGAFPLGQVLATLAFLALAWHAWIGVRDIWMDYARADGVRLLLQVLTALWLVAAVVFFVKVLWSL